MPSELKRAYMEALARCPNIVNDESHPCAMLRADNYDPAVSCSNMACLSFFASGSYSYTSISIIACCPTTGKVLANSSIAVRTICFLANDCRRSTST
jgi:hypothetical protein